MSEDMEQAATDEQQLVDRLRQRDSRAYHEAVQQFSGAMLATARSMLDPATAEDVVQESWVAVVDAIDGFEGRSALKTWLCTITANRARNRLRKSKRETLTDFQAPLDPNLEKRFNEGGGWIQPTRPWGSESADELLSNEALKDCLDKHFEALPETQRAVLMMREMQQMEADDVCRILGLSSANLRVSLHRARQKLFTMIEGFRETGEC
ncbi:RNA polymerase sigma factor [Halospina denitrificans]|nr:sigma-70 family RNA polymerase sigma factor [Halospina denitrificans]